jgi:hypothetical protein
MKPLAGGLLTSSKAFPPRPWRPGLPEPLPARDLLRFLLMDEAVSCVVPGTASPAEAAENAAAGCGDIRLDDARMQEIRTHARAMTTSLCSRCGACDDLCSRGLPVSFLFRAAYNYLFPSAPFEISSSLQYFKLHPGDRALCESCDDRTCRCVPGIDIPAEMIALHRKMVELRDRGQVPAAVEEDGPPDRPWSARLLSRDLPEQACAGDPAAVVRLHLRNTGWRPWFSGREDGRVFLAVTLDGLPLPEVTLRHDVWPGQQGHFAFAVPLVRSGTRRLRMELHDAVAGPLARHGVAAFEATFEVARPAGEPPSWAERLRAALSALGLGL